MKKTLLSLVAAACVALNAWAEGTESFEKAPEQSEIDTYTYTGDNGQTWTIIGTTDYYISDWVGAVLYAYDSDGKSVSNGITGNFNSAQLAQGVGTVSFKVKAAGGSKVGWGKRTFTVAVGSVSVPTTVTIPNSSTIVTATADINLTAAQLTSSSQLKITMQGVASGECGFIVDDLAWTSYSGLTDTPTMTVAGYQDQNSKIYWGSEVLAQFASTTENATFYYTLDGTEPTQSSASGESVSLPLDATTTVKAIAVTEAKGTSEVATFSVTTAAGTINAADGTTTQPNERWATTGTISKSTTAYSTTSTSSVPYLYLSSKGATIITEDYLSPQAFSLYIGSTANISLKASFQTGNFKLVDGTYTWQPATADWIELGTFTNSKLSQMHRVDFTLPDSIKNSRVRFKLYSQNAANIDDITTVTRAAEAVETPTFSQASGDVVAGTSITVACPTAATLHYRVNSGEWQTSTADAAISINAKTTITAYATQEGKFDSYIAEATYQLPTTKSPEFSKASGSTLYQGDEIVISSATDGATIVYRINKGDEKTGSTPLTLTVNGQIDSITAYCTLSGLIDSDPVTVSYKSAKVEKPQCSNTAESVLKGDQIQFYSTTENATLHYRIDDGEWQTATGSTNITIEGSCTITAYATKDKYLPSDTLTQRYTVALGQLPTPTVDQPSGTLLNANDKVTLSFKNGATLHYRVNSGEWQTAENQDSYTLIISENSTIEAYVSQQDYVDSEKATFVYRIARGKVATPYVVSGVTEVESNQQINIKTDTEGAKLYYDIDHSDNWINGYSKITYNISQRTTIRAYAVCDDYFASDTLEVTFTVKVTPTAIAAVAQEFALYTEQQQIVVENATNAEISIYTALGALVSHQRITTNRAQFSVPTHGLYLVRINQKLYKITL